MIGNRVKPGNEDGFTLIELLVVILIIGILAAIAIPSFLNQREKGQDACAKSQARTMATAMETYYTDHNSYSGADMDALHAIEAAVTGTGACGNGTEGGIGLAVAAPVYCDATSGASDTEYCVVHTSAATGGGGNHIFVIRKAAGEPMTRICTPAGQGGCASNNTW